MAETTKIQWADKTFNPWIGCTKVAPGCANCYAEADMDKRRGRVRWGPNGTRSKTSENYWREPLRWEKQAAAEGVRPRVFCASLADVFEAWDGPIVDHTGAVLMRCLACHQNRTHKRRCDACDEVVDGRPLTMADLRRDLFALIDATPHLDWLILTKRPENVLRMWPGVGEGDYPRRNDSLDDLLPMRRNVHLLTSVSDQATADAAVPRLLECRDLVPVLGLSCEPLLGPVDLSAWLPTIGKVGMVSAEYERQTGVKVGDKMSVIPIGGAIDWVIAGGESGPGARPCRVEWIESIVDQCRDADVPCFVKQLGADPRWPSLADASAYDLISRHPKGGDPAEWPAELRVQEFPNPLAPLSGEE